GAAQRGTVQVQAPAAADDGRARLPVHAGDVVQPDQGRVSGGDGLLGAADLQGGLGLAGLEDRDVSVTVEAVLADLVAGLDLDQADVQPGVLVRREGQGPGDVE